MYDGDWAQSPIPNSQSSFNNYDFILKTLKNKNVFQKKSIK